MARAFRNQHSCSLAGTAPSTPPAPCLQRAPATAQIVRQLSSTAVSSFIYHSVQTRNSNTLRYQTLRDKKPAAAGHLSTQSDGITLCELNAMVNACQSAPIRDAPDRGQPNSVAIVPQIQHRMIAFHVMVVRIKNTGVTRASNKSLVDATSVLLVKSICLRSGEYSAIFDACIRSTLCGGRFQFQVQIAIDVRNRRESHCRSACHQFWATLSPPLCQRQLVITIVQWLFSTLGWPGSCRSKFWSLVYACTVSITDQTSRRIYR